MTRVALFSSHPPIKARIEALEKRALTRSQTDLSY